MKEQKKPFYCSDRLELDENERCITQCDHCAPKEKLLVQNLIDMMQEDEELGLYDIFNDEKRQGVKEFIDEHKQNNMISDWLEQNRNPEIDKQVEKELEFLSKERLEKYSERFDNTKSEIGNSETWGKRIKQETLEEAALRLYPIILEDDRWDKNKQYRDEWIEGAKWQAKRMHSEEEVLEIIRQYALEEHLITSSKPDIWFEQFKKK